MNTFDQEKVDKEHAREVEALRIADGRDAMLEPETKSVAGYNLRAYAFGSNTIARKIGLTMFVDEDAVITEDEAMTQLMGFFWMQSTEIDDVLDAVDDGTFQRKIDRFAMTVPIHHIDEMMKEVERVSKLAASAAVKIEAQDSNIDTEAPKN